MVHAAADFGGALRYQSRFLTVGLKCTICSSIQDVTEGTDSHATAYVHFNSGPALC